MLLSIIYQLLSILLFFFLQDFLICLYLFVKKEACKLRLQYLQIEVKNFARPFFNRPIKSVGQTLSQHTQYTSDKLDFSGL